MAEGLVPLWLEAEQVETICVGYFLEGAVCSVLDGARTWDEDMSSLFLR